MRRPLSELLVLAATIVSAAVIGFGIPLLWVWIGSQLQGGSGATTLNFSVAMAILFGIIASYGIVLYIAGWLMTRTQGPPEKKQTSTAREPWMRGMTDTRDLRHSKGPQMGAIERVFVITTLLVTGAAWIWFLFFAEGGGLPSQ
jgi:hypothetical protein